jgi:hypothetical protein
MISVLAPRNASLEPSGLGHRYDPGNTAPAGHGVRAVTRPTGRRIGRVTVLSGEDLGAGHGLTPSAAPLAAGQSASQQREKATGALLPW